MQNILLAALCSFFNSATVFMSLSLSLLGETQKLQYVVLGFRFFPKMEMSFGESRVEENLALVLKSVGFSNDRSNRSPLDFIIGSSIYQITSSYNFCFPLKSSPLKDGLRDHFFSGFRPLFLTGTLSLASRLS